MTSVTRLRVMKVLRLVSAPLLLGGVVWLAGPQAIWAAVQGANAWWLLAGLLTATVGNASAALRWAELARWLGHRVRGRWALAVYFKAVAVNALLPGAVIGGDMFRAWQLHREGCPKGAAGLSVVLDRLSGLWILFALSAMSLFVGVGSPEMDTLRRVLRVPEAWPTVVVAVALLALVLLLPLGGLIAVSAVVGHRARPGSRRAMAVDLLQRPAALRQYLRQAAASLVVGIFSAGALYCAARAFRVDLPGWLIALTAAPIFLLAALPVSFGGWGTREAATVTGWAVFGVAPPLAVGAAAAVGVYALLQAALGLFPLPAARRSVAALADGA
ncbi:MAG: lysylphosphatidylglycerol synthase transmembrane domain-containing protein [Pseudomonadota bacterium]|nr:lysylphosphatidylglycerol synthase transmembrane domain-containing protein [Pseudomonadota bacterium]